MVNFSKPTRLPLWRFLLLAVLMPLGLRAQNAAQYIFSTSTGTYTPITGTAVAILGDDLYTATGIPIGFNFNFCGVQYSTFKVSSNGWLSFGNPTSSNLGNTTAALANIAPALLPLWDDLDGAMGSAFYTVNGTAPNREFVMEWRDWQWNFSATGIQISFQVKLFEATGIIHYIYRQESGAINLPSATIGIGRTQTDYLVLNNSTAAPVASSTTFTDNIATKPATGQIYIFSPPLPNNAAATAVTDPTNNFCSGTHLVKATINNNGSNAITNVKVNWSVDGVLQPQVTHSTSIAVGGNASVSLGNVSFSNTLKTIKVWTSEPNGVPDAVPGDDTFTATRTAVPPPAAFITPQGPTHFCPGGNVELKANTGTSLTYQWKRNGTNVVGGTGASYIATQQGIYTVVVNNGACVTESPSVNIIVGPPVLNLGNDSSFCERKQPFELNIAQANAKYRWSTGDSSQSILITHQGGTYWAEVSLGPGCTTSDTITLDISPLPRVTGISYIKEGGYLYFLEAAGGQFVDKYQWIFSDNTTDTGIKVAHTFPVGQHHSVRLVVSNQCSKDSVELQLPLAVAGLQSSVTADVYPNPASDKLNVHIRSAAAIENVRLVVTDILGKQLVNEQYSKAGTELNKTLDVSAYPAGTYFVELHIDNQKTVKRIVVE